MWRENKVLKHGKLRPKYSTISRIKELIYLKQKCIQPAYESYPGHPAVLGIEKFIERRLELLNIQLSAEKVAAK